ncbi:head-tail adaptor protein [Streptomyces africanus]|uniref:head-tail adaptor protein n=1 Tax=Streptomyces africanus TaxID=231024 RepID=UPI000A3D2FA6|nr:head-tail adaptor protein [Streptomyces africanus]
MPGPIGRQTITILLAALVDGDYNTQVRDWDHPQRIPISGCTVDYTSNSRVRQAGDQTTTRAQLLMPPRAMQITTGMRVEWDGRTWDIDGVPAHAEAAGPLSGQVVNLLEVKGA